MLRGAERRRGPIFRLGAGDRALTQDAPGTHLHVPARGEHDKFRGLAFGILTKHESLARGSEDQISLKVSESSKRCTVQVTVTVKR